MKKYDAMYIFTQSGNAESWAKITERMQAEITRLGGTILTTEDLGKKTFARVQQKNESGAYLKIRFEFDPANITILHSKYALIEDLFRVQILAVNDIIEAKLVEQAAARKAREEARAAKEAAAIEA